MTNRADILEALAKRVEKASGPDQETDARIWCALNDKEWLEPPYEAPMPDYDVDASGQTLVVGITRAGLMLQSRIAQSPRYTTSLDAAMTLVPESAWDHMEVYRPDHQTLGWTVHLLPNANMRLAPFTGFAQTHALALTAACLRAHASIERTKNNG